MPKHEALRREFYHGWVTRASDQSADRRAVGQHRADGADPRAAAPGRATRRLSELRRVLARHQDGVLGRAKCAHFSNSWHAQSRPVAQREYDELTQFAGRELNAWDVAFYAERLKRQRLQLSEEALRPYFPLPRVLAGMFAVAEKLMACASSSAAASMSIIRTRASTTSSNADGSQRGGFFVDLYARPKKRGGAWMDECVGRKRLADTAALPVAYLVCNFMPPVGTQPSLLTHSEVVTMFHEFGHGLHHMLTRVDYPSIAGINGVAWDAVELPSQFMENFAWRAEVLPLISGHVETGEPLPQSELQRLLGNAHISGRACRRCGSWNSRCSICAFTARTHRRRAQRIMRTLAEVRAQVAVVKPPPFNRFPHSFQHIFSGGYAAGYYSYKWAEVLAADAFSAFEEQGIFNADVVAPLPEQRSWSRAAAATRWKRSWSSAAASRKSNRC